MEAGHLSIRKAGENKIRYFELAAYSEKSEMYFYWRAFNVDQPLFSFSIVERVKPPAELFFSNTSEIPQTHEAYLKMIAATVLEIKNRKWSKVVMSRTKKVPFDSLNTVALFQELTEKYPNATVYLFSHPDCGTWMGATPETLITRKGNKVVSMSLAGTQKSPDDFTKKEIEEQQPVTDYILGKLKGNLHLQHIIATEVEKVKAGPVYHLRAMVSAIAGEGFKTQEMAEALHPTPAVGGSPRKEALEYIQKNEGYNRASYTGYFGLTKGDEESFYVNLRCMQIFPDHCLLYAGGGITALSNPEAEWQETENKMQTLEDLLKPYS